LVVESEPTHCFTLSHSQAGVEWKMMKNERWAVVGPNGTGKSTLLKAITGQDGVKLTTGRMVLHPTCRVGYLEQKGVSGSTRTVEAEVKSRMDRLVKATAALAAAEKELETMDTSDSDALELACAALADAQEEFETCGGYEADEKVARILKGLGFTEADYERPCTSFR
jgi:ATP-binding cassette subfamily F protein 3